jgi:magnesium chelatase family protein
MLDRIDLHIEVPAVAYAELSSREPGEPSSAMRARVEQARRIQQERLIGKSKVSSNARMPSKLIKTYCQLDDAGQEMLKMAMNELNFSARAYDRILKVARTIADLDKSENIQANHLGEAIQYRTLDRNLWV